VMKSVRVHLRVCKCKWVSKTFRMCRSSEYKCGVVKRAIRQQWLLVT
jgi:hypothetical protein